MTSPLEDREKKLRGLIDDTILKGWGGAKFGGGGCVNIRDIALITPYCKSLGYLPKIQGDGIELVPLITPPEPPTNEEPDWAGDEINISLDMYNYLKFCQENPICRMLYKFSGKRVC